MQYLMSLYADNKPLFYAAVMGSILLLVVLAIVAWRLFQGRGVRVPGASRTRQMRLGVVDVHDLDRERQLVLVRRDNVEHLIMIGGPNDVLIESSIIRVEARQQRAENVAGSGIAAPAPAVAAPARAVAAPPLPVAAVVPVKAATVLVDAAPRPQTAESRQGQEVRAIAPAAPLAEKPPIAVIAKVPSALASTSPAPPVVIPETKPAVEAAAMPPLPLAVPVRPMPLPPVVQAPRSEPLLVAVPTRPIQPPAVVPAPKATAPMPAAPAMPVAPMARPPLSERFPPMTLSRPSPPSPVAPMVPPDLRPPAPKAAVPAPPVPAPPVPAPAVPDNANAAMDSLEEEMAKLLGRPLARPR